MRFIRVRFGRECRCVAAGLKITLAAYSSTPRELSWQYLDIKPRVVLVARHLVPVVEQMFALIGSSPEEAKRRIWVMDTLSDVPLLEGSQAERAIAIDEGTSGASGLHRLVGTRALEREELFDGDTAEETVYICYSSGTTVSLHTVLFSIQSYLGDNSFFPMNRAGQRASRYAAP